MGIFQLLFCVVVLLQCVLGMIIPNPNTDSSSSRVYSSNQATSTQPFPYMVAIGAYLSSNTKATYVCGGSLISNNWVVTSAHCVEIYRSYSLQVLAGVVDVTNEGSNSQSSGVSSRISYPNYKTGLMNYDIGLLKLTTSFNKTSYVKPITVAANGTDVVTAVMFTGYGYPTISTTLRYSTILTKTSSVCSQYQPSSLDTTNLPQYSMFCAGSSSNLDFSVACQDDDGSPLVNINTNQLMGISSYANSCDLKQKGYPSAFTNVTYYSDWINTQTGSGSNFAPLLLSIILATLAPCFL